MPRSLSGDRCVSFRTKETYTAFRRLPRFVVAEGGEALWIEAAKDQITFADLERTREAGYFEGDPYGLFVKQFLGGDGVIPGWEDLLGWLNAIGGVAQFLGLLHSRYRKYVKRGARRMPSDLITARDEWRRQDLQGLLGLEDQEAIDLAESIPAGELWRTPSDLRRNGPSG